MKDVDDMILVVRAQEREASILNCVNSIITFAIDAAALVCKWKPLKVFAFIWTILNVGDQIRMIHANKVAKKEAIELIEDDDTRDMAEEFSSLSGLAETVGLQGIKYQLTGKYKYLNI